MSSVNKQHRRGGRLWAVAASGALCVAGLVLLIVFLVDQEPPPPQAPAAQTASSSSDSSSSSSSSGATTPPSSDAEQTPSTSAAPSTPAVLPASKPVRIRVPDRDIDGAVFGIPLADDGTLPAPSGARKDDAAWFDGSPTPGEQGPAVIEGHVTYSGKPSVFFELGAVRKGDRVDVERADGSTATFEVYDVGRFPKDSFPTWAVYENTSSAELRMITCGGTVDAAGRHADNVIVFARLVDEG
ncbi:class F sortase [Brachybacterium halotolerans subsp. kimchii]|uniref:class F sortase n=1 Tax=Brachybacterium halotolerans TaxID=2795215 RepID=UPI001E2FFCD7|nr:class F sortase [Brachybacterium halotolerans]UEJ81728.1 class F sortase [Brachybacterium halotolerans subsp. kimchii]